MCYTSFRKTTVKEKQNSKLSEINDNGVMKQTSRLCEQFK